MSAPAPAPEPNRQKQVSAEEESKATPYRAFVREFFVDFLGSLVPGFLFCVTSALILGWALLFSWRSIDPEVGQGLLKAALEAIRFELLGLVLVVSYVMGSIFYRQDPKQPDQESATFLVKNMSTENVDKAAVRKDKDGKVSVEFPYLYLYEYLSARGLEHLAARIPWKGTTPATHPLRSKMFINLLKIRLQFHIPHKCAELVRHEAHVRMMSSVWYAAQLLRWVGLIAGVLALGGLYPTPRDTRVWGEFAAIIVGAIGLSLAAWYFMHTIRRFFFYQRVREIVQVLETAHAATLSTGINFFANLDNAPKDPGAVVPPSST